MTLSHELCKTAEPIEMLFWDVGTGGLKEPCIRWAPDLYAKGQFLGDRRWLGIPDDTLL